MVKTITRMFPLPYSYKTEKPTPKQKNKQNKGTIDTGGTSIVLSISA